jgi:hypothetical protein
MTDDQAHTADNDAGLCSECGHGVERHDPFGCWFVDCICRRTPANITRAARVTPPGQAPS